jgi:hypothetical protein
VSDDPKTDQPRDLSEEAAFAAFVREVGDQMAAREADNPSPPAPREPWVDKPGTLIAAEKEVLCCRIIERLELLLCGGPGNCARSRCRRSRRCAQLESLKPMAEAARATLASEQAKWRPSPAPEPAPSGRRQRRRRRPA